MAGVPDNQSNIVLLSELNSCGDMRRFRNIDRID